MPVLENTCSMTFQDYELFLRNKPSFKNNYYLSPHFRGVC